MSSPVEYHYAKQSDLGEVEAQVLNIVSNEIDKRLEELAQGLETGVTKSTLNFVAKFVGPGGLLKDVVVDFYFKSTESPESTAVTLESSTQQQGVGWVSAATDIGAMSPTELPRATQRLA